jgi:hypothetical protein
MWDAEVYLLVHDQFYQKYSENRGIDV